MPDPERLVAADDNADIRGLLQRRLARRGWDVRLAADGEEALSLVADFRPAAALFDISMPGIGGLEALARLRAQPATHELPILIMSARAGADDSAAAIAAGADGFVEKPFVFNELDATLRRLCASHPGRTR